MHSRQVAATAPQIAAFGVVRDVGEGFVIGRGGLLQSAGAAQKVRPCGVEKVIVAQTGNLFQLFQAVLWPARHADGDEIRNDPAWGGEQT